MTTNQNILAILKDIFRHAKIFYDKLYTNETTSKAATTKFLSKIPNRKKISNEQFNFKNLSLYEIIKSINSLANNKSDALCDALTAEFHKNFSNELALVLLDLYQGVVRRGQKGLKSPFKY